MSNCLRIFTIFSLFVVLFYASLQNNDLYADAPVQGVQVNTVGIPNSNFSNLATTPPVYLDSTSLGTIAGGAAGGIFNIIMGYFKIAKGKAILAIPGVNVFGKIKAAYFLTTGGISVGLGISAVFYSILGSAGLGKAMVSFVGDPREFYPNVFPPLHPDLPYAGMMKMEDKDSNGNFRGFKPVKGSRYTVNGRTYTCNKETDCIFLGMRAKGADKIVVCSRNTGLLTFFGINGSCYGRGRKGSEYAEGPQAYLCPEELRQVGRVAEPEPDKSTGYRKLKCNKKNLKECPEDSKLNVVPNAKALEDFKLTYGSPECKIGRDREVVSIHGFNYKIFSSGTRLCAKLVGLLGGLPWPQSYNIGCISKLDSKVSAKCPNSVPIFEDFEVDRDTGLIVNNGHPCMDKSVGSACTPEKIQNRIVKYDDSNCYNRCAVSQMCTTVARGVFHAPIPITTYLMACIKDSVGNLLYGCNTLSTSNNSNSYDQSKDEPYSKGLLGVVQQRMRPIIMSVLLLSIILFAMQLMMFDSMPKLPEIMAYLLKIAIVLYLTNAKSGENGMEVYGGYIDKISTGLQAMVLDNRGSKMCNYRNKSYTINIPIGSGKVKRKDFSYLKMWDIVDCHLAYYFSGGLVDAAVGTVHRNGLVRRPFDVTAFDYLAGIFNGAFELIIILACTFVFGFLNLFIVIQVVELMILSILAFHVLILISPIFVPFLLFKATKQTFDGWVNQIIVYSLYPIMIFAFLSFMYVIIDKLYFGDTVFVERQSYVAGNLVSTFSVDGSALNTQPSSCNGFSVYKDRADMAPGRIPLGCDCNAVGCMLNAVVIGTQPNAESIIGPVVGAKVTASREAFKKFELSWIAMIFIIFVMYHFAKLLPQIAQALSGSTKALMNSGRSIRSASNRMDGLSAMVAGAFKSNKRPAPENGGDGKDDKGKASRPTPVGSASTK